MKTSKKEETNENINKKKIVGQNIAHRGEVQREHPFFVQTNVAFLPYHTQLIIIPIFLFPKHIVFLFSPHLPRIFFSFLNKSISVCW